ncbi:hypothetical protein XBKB1_2380002 [Xenorhabdus bovienii str. kraussei Becker Underwood]|uniref:Uncharacterized protein n=1 Tax=Xenorhabdus bovienii str. kraussei Becker Underwood TaxID=1398204 RepID=A0A077PTH2_XENBV|nr:hypothetical protein XBKB1_2380002 [Xenorhabdus bovienii str. kraussei Becker Underwood]
MSAFQHVADGLTHGVSVRQLSCFQRSAAIGNHLIIVAGHQNLLSVAVHYQIGIVSHNDNLPVLFYLTEQWDEMVHDKVVIKVVLGLVEHKR